MLQKFYPEKWVTSTYSIDFAKLYKEGYRGLLFDIDNTLVKHGEDATEEAVRLFKRLKDMGFEVCLISNNQIERVERFNKEIKVNYIYNAHKPSRKNYLKAMELMHTDLTNTMFIGDQLFTDVYGAKRCGMHHILVEPIDKNEEIQIVLKRYLERIVLHFYKKTLK
ncbi:MAG: YqeG family HAD IIIA-type phosphatase [bacterium]|nr:YqeG family HAD IIIA-type phosphatase [bacterium]